MIEFLFADPNQVFTIAFGIVLALGLLEGLGLLIGLSLSTMLDNLTPIEWDMDIDTNTEFSGGGLTQIIGWLCLNRLPLMIWLVLFLSSFSISGYASNFLALSVLDRFLPTWMALVVGLFGAVMLTRRCGPVLADILPKNESSALSVESFSGAVATITQGTARVGSPTEASFVDNFQQKHYVLVEPMESDQEFGPGQQVVLIQKGPNSWTATSYHS